MTPSTTRGPGAARPGVSAAGPSAAFDPDRVVRLLATDGYAIHRLVYAVFATAGARDFLYTPFALGGALHAVHVRHFDVATRFAAGDAFEMRLRALPTVKSGGRARSIGAARAKDALRRRWLLSRAAAHGFMLLEAPRIRTERVRLETAKRPFAFNACRYRVRIRITDPLRFTRAYTRGIGRGRAWGCAMPMLRTP